MEFPVLYHEGKNGIVSWRIWTEGADIVQEYGLVEGKKTGTRKTAKSKNIGKKNETTPNQQAESEAQSIWQKKKDTKYSETIEESKKVVFLPMLANDLKKSKKPLLYPIYVQPKLDGLRCMAFWENNKIKLMSRGGKEWNIKHIENALVNILPKDFVFDGELYIHGIALQDINHYVKSPQLSEHLEVEYHIFDGFYQGKTDEPWNLRSRNLMSLLHGLHFEGPLFQVQGYSVNNQEELEAAKARFEHDGYEGIIIRIENGVYELGHRSRNLWKLKSFIDAEFPIVGFKEANGNDIGTVVWICELPNGGTVEAKPKGTRARRREMFKNAKDYLGKKLTIKFQGFSNEGSLIFPVGICIRGDDE